MFLQDVLIFFVSLEVARRLPPNTQPKDAHVPTSLLTSCPGLVINEPISGCVRGSHDL